MRENKKRPCSEVLRRSSRLPRKHREQIRKLQSEDEYKKFLRGLPPKERIFLLTDYGYKFSKSDPALAEYFAEGRYAPCVPGALSLDSGHGLSFMIEKEILLKASIYGDQLTRFSFREQDPYFPDIANARIVYEGGMLETYRSDVLFTEHNFPMSCPHTIKALVKACGSQCAFLNLIHQNVFLMCETLEETYRILGFRDSAEFLHDIRRISAETPCYRTVQDRVDALLPGDITI